MVDKPKELKSLGYANGWGDSTPELVAKCEHVGYTKNIGNCLNEFGCEICGYKYLVDSSD
jgi:hypothetical protein